MYCMYCGRYTECGDNICTVVGTLNVEITNNVRLEGHGSSGL